MATQVGGEKAGPITTKNIGQNFPSFRRRNKPARYSVEGPRVSALPKFLAATRKGASRTGRHPLKPPEVVQRPLRWFRQQVSDSAPRPEHKRQVTTSQSATPRMLLAPLVTEAISFYKGTVLLPVQNLDI